MGPSSLSSWASLIARTLPKYGIAPRDLLACAGIGAERLADPNGRVAMAAMQRLWAAAVEASGDACFGLEVGRGWHATAFHALGYSALASATLREALTCVARYCQVVSTGADIVLVDDARGVLVQMQPRAPLGWSEDALRAVAQAALASLTRLCRTAQPGVAPDHVLLRQREHSGAARLQAYFEAPVSFGASVDALVFRPADLDTPVPSANPVLRRVNEEALSHYRARLDATSLAGRVRQRLIEMLPGGDISEAGIARALHQSPRSVQRKLHSEGVTFRDLLDTTRRELAARYEKDPSLSRAEIAFLLGFSEPSSFARARRRWQPLDRACEAVNNDRSCPE